MTMGRRRFAAQLVNYETTKPAAPGKLSDCKNHKPLKLFRPPGHKNG